MKSDFAFQTAFLTFFALWMLTADGFTQAPGTDNPQNSPSHTSAKLISDVRAIRPGVPFKVGALLHMQPGWHTYYKDSGDAGMPTRIRWQLPPGFTAGELLWQKPHRFEEAGIVTYGYANQDVVAAVITPPRKFSGPVPITAEVKWLCCKSICIPGKAHLTLTLASTTATPAPSQDAPLFQDVGWMGSVTSLSETPKTMSGPSADNRRTPISDGSALPLLLGLAFAFIGGLILNFMPCVLPVIALKVVGIVEQAHGNLAVVRQHALAFTGGMMGTFLLMAGAVIVIQASGGGAGWGFLFQFPAFIAGMSVVVWLFALSLLGLFYMSLPQQDAVNKLSRRGDLTGTFFKGILATLLSTPCSAPFLGTALGFAFTQPPAIIVLVFATIGAGMALPYLLLLLRPELLKYLPKPGAWMETFKELMGFVLIATVLWLLSILGHMTGTGGLIRTLIFIACVSWAAWLVARFTNLSSGLLRRGLVWAFALATVCAGFFGCYAQYPGLGLTPSPAESGGATVIREGGITWQPYTPAALNQARQSGKAVLLDVTADWCLTCKVNERTVLESQSVKDKLKTLAIVPMQADWTTQNPAITMLLKQFHRSGVPLYVLFPAGPSAEPIALPEVITQAMVLKALDQLNSPPISVDH